MHFDSKEYQQVLRDWFSDWVKSQEDLRPRGWKQQFERDSGMITGYFYKLQSGNVEFDIDNLTKIANQIGMLPSQILSQVEKRIAGKKI